MKKIRFSDNWYFNLENNMEAYNLYGLQKCGEATGAPARFYENTNWEKVTLPHDWAIKLPVDLNAARDTGGRAITDQNFTSTLRRSGLDEIYNIGWYRKSFVLGDEYKDKKIYLEFEGVSRNYTIWVNGVYMEHHLSGYTPCVLDITDQILINEHNSIAVRVDSEQVEGWWYDGAGIYRHVNLLVGDPLYITPYSTFVTSKNDGNVNVKTTVTNDNSEEQTVNITASIFDMDGNEIASKNTLVCVSAFSEEAAELSINIESPILWNLDNPYLYKLVLKANNDTEITKFGIREFVFDSENGFFLNGTRVQINGACVHQDFGGVGAALSDNLHRYKIQKLKELGINAYRTAHHPPAPELLDACDELGMLIMDETRCFGTSPEAQRQLRTLIRRDRNHPCVVLWSIGNEEHTTQNNNWGKKLATKMKRIVYDLDGTRPITYGGNNGLSYDGINEVVDVRGINYIRGKAGIEGNPDDYHKAHPHQPMVGSEETSFVLTRGEPKTIVEQSKLSCFGDVTMPWGITPEGYLKFYNARKYLCGAFLWTGFDYHGEPAPFERHAVSSNFGIIDLAGFKKPVTYYFKAWWKDEPIIKIFPSWNFKEGEMVDIGVCTNCEEVSLYLNDKLLETKTVNEFDLPRWTVKFEPGTLKAVGKKDGNTYTDEIKTSGKVCEVQCEVELKAENKNDISLVTLRGLDQNKNFCHTADCNLSISIDGGEIVGVVNGDSLSTAYEQKPSEEEFMRINYVKYNDGIYAIPKLTSYKTVPEKIYFKRDDEKSCFADPYRLVFEDVYLPPKKDEYIIEVEDAAKYEYIEFERLNGETTIYLNGKCIGDNKGEIVKGSRPYRFYCDFAEGKNEIKIVSEYHKFNFGIEGTVKLGRKKVSPWETKLYYGLSRVLVKSDGDFKIHANIID